MVRDKVVKVLEKIRPYIQSDGGDISLVDIDEQAGIVKVALHGACGTCPSSTATLKGGVERMIRAEVPEIKEVVAV
ncbi:MAG: NifU family protein [Elusimicrobia bacterium]|nr:NifU family protein [Elusimicrobiota bacterium]